MRRCLNRGHLTCRILRRPWKHRRNTFLKPYIFNIFEKILQNHTKLDILAPEPHTMECRIKWKNGVCVCAQWQRTLAGLLSGSRNRSREISFYGNARAWQPRESPLSIKNESRHNWRMRGWLAAGSYGNAFFHRRRGGRDELLFSLSRARRLNWRGGRTHPSMVVRSHAVGMLIFFLPPVVVIWKSDNVIDFRTGKVVVVLNCFEFKVSCCMQEFYRATLSQEEMDFRFVWSSDAILR